MNKESFKTSFAKNIFYQKYALTQNETWYQRAITIVDSVCGTNGGTERPLMSEENREFLIQAITDMKFLPGGRYVYYAGRTARFYNNCYLLKGEEDTREEWAAVAQRSMSCLMTGGGIGIDYSIFRPEGHILSRTGGQSSGPIPLMKTVNEIGRNVMQGGSRRSAIYASLNWQHEDAPQFLSAKDWHSMQIGDQLKEDGTPYTMWDAKQVDFNYPAPLDMTNISLNYDNDFLEEVYQLSIEEIESIYKSGEDLVIKKIPELYVQNVRQALITGEPGLSFNFFSQLNQTLRNACCEVVSEDDSDVCNLGSVNLGNIENIEEFKKIVEIASEFLVCGTIRAELPYQKVHDVREKNRRLGLGLMGIHEWLLKRGLTYEVTPELHKWLSVYRDYSKESADQHCERLFISKPVAYRAIAPTGSIGILASTTTGIEPLFAVAYKRRYLVEGTKWKYEYVVDATAEHLITEYGVDPETIETALSLAKDPERRIKFQADIQDYVDMAISSTINLPEWGSNENNESKVQYYAETLLRYAHRLRGFTCYPDGSRGGQPLTVVAYEKAMQHKGTVFEEHDICDITGHGGSCGQ